MARFALAFALALAPVAAAAFNPDPRPAPAGVDLVCADDPAVACHPNTAATDIYTASTGAVPCSNSFQLCWLGSRMRRISTARSAGPDNAEPRSVIFPGRAFWEIQYIIRTPTTSRTTTITASRERPRRP